MLTESPESKAEIIQHDVALALYAPLHRDCIINNVGPPVRRGVVRF